LVSPFVNETWHSMLWQAVAGMRFKMSGGYLFIPSPRGADLFAPPSPLSDALSNAEAGRTVPVLDPGTRAGMGADLQRWHIREIIVGPIGHEADAVRFVTQLMRRRPELSGGIYIWRNVSASEVH